MILWIILSLLVIFIAVLLIRTLRFKPVKEDLGPVADVTFDKEAAINSLAELVKCKTVSYYDPSLEDKSEFDKLLRKLPKLYPYVIKTCEYTEFPDRGILFKWKGKTTGTKNPTVLMAHFDVVPVDKALWTKPAFDGLIEDGILWGRGSLDTKSTFNGILFAANHLMSKGFQPENDIYFAFSGQEEINGPGAVNIVNYFKEQGISPDLVIDEGGAVVEDVFPGVSEACGLIGIAEKGMMNIEYTLHSDGGHASSPAPHTPLGIMSKACCAIENHPFKVHYTKPVLEMFDTLGRYSTFLYRMIFANLWCFSGILDIICKKSGGELNALVRTTVAFTMANGSNACNVIPPSVSMVSNIRLNPEDTMDSAKTYIKDIIKNEDIKLRIFDGMNPSPISRTDCKGWSIIKKSVADTWKGCVVAPYLMVQCSDSRHYADISDKVYRFSAMDLTAEERHTIHGNDEHIRLETIERSVEFFIRVMLQC